MTSNVSRGFFLSDNNASQLGTSYNLYDAGTLNVTSVASYNAGNTLDRRLRSVWFGKGGEGAVSGSVTGDLFDVHGGTATFAHNPANGSSDLLISRNSTLLIEGGTTTFNDYNEIRVGYGMGGADPNLGVVPTGANGSNITVSAGVLDVNGFTPMVLGFADNGALSISGGTVTLDSYVQLGAVGGGLGSVTMTGGSLSTLSINWIGGIFTFDGGDIFLPGDQRALLDQPWFDEAPGAIATYDAGLDQTHLAVVPEPAAVVALCGGAGLLALRRRRR